MTKRRNFSDQFKAAVALEALRDRLHDLLRNRTRMKLRRTLAAWRPDLTGHRDAEEAYKIGLKSLARRYHERHDEVAELDDTDQ